MLLATPNNLARPPPYAFSVGTSKDSVQETLAINVRALMDRRGWKQEKLAEMAGMSQTHVGNILRKTAAPSSAVISKLAHAFGMPEWQLLVPNMPIEILDSKELPALLQTWLATRVGR